MVELEKLVGELCPLQRLMLILREVVRIPNHRLVRSILLFLSAFLHKVFDLVRALRAEDFSLSLYVVLESVVLQHFVERFGWVYKSDLVVFLIDHWG